MADIGRNRPMGEASSTTGGFTAAIKLFDKYQASRSDPTFANLSAEDVENDNLTKLLTDFASWFAFTPVAASNNPGSNIGPETKAKYFGKLAKAFREKFPSHEAYMGVHPKDDPAWLKEMRDMFLTEAKRLKLEAIEEGYRDPKIRGVYKDVPATPGLVRSHLRGDTGTVQDLNGVNKMLIYDASKSAGPYSNNFERRAQLTTEFMSVGRGGEPKFMRLDEMQWDPFFECLDGLWTELKTLKQYCMPYCPDRDSYLSDWYHATGSFWAVEDGLYRGDTTKTTAKFMYPSHLLSDPERLARGGWSSGNKSDHYAESNVALALPGGLALGGWQDPHARVYPPRLECLGAEALPLVESFIDSLYVVSLDLLKPDGHLRPLLRTCTASLIMYFPITMRDFGPTNPLNSKLIRSASAALTQHGMTGADMLQNWAQTIKEDFCERNVEISPATPSTILETLNKQTEMIVAMRRAVNDMGVLVQNVSHEVVSTRAENVTLRAELKAVLEDLKRTRASSMAPPSPKRRHTEGPMTMTETNSLVVEPNATAADIETRVVPADVSASETSSVADGGARNVNNALFHGMRAEAAAESNKGVPLSSIIQQLHESGQLAKETIVFKTTSLSHLSSTDTDKYRDAMEVVQQVWDGNLRVHRDSKGRDVSDMYMTSLEEHKTVLKNPLSPTEDVKRAAEAIESFSMSRMLELENELLDEPKKKIKCKAKPYVGGFGKRYQIYRKKAPKKAPERGNSGGLTQFLRKK